MQFNRTVASFLSGDGAAVSAFRAIVERDDWQTEFSIDAAILGYFAALRSNQKDPAAVLLKDAAAQYGNRKTVWPYPIVRFLRGEIDESKLLASAEDDETIDLRCCLRVAALQGGKGADARAHFLWVTEQNEIKSSYFLIALAELSRLAKDEPRESRR